MTARPDGRSRLAHASFWAIAGNGTQHSIVFLLLVYLAHVLQPRDFGLMATVSIGLDLGTRIARWGQVELLQQPRYRNDESRNQSLRLSLAIAFVFFALFVVAARPLGQSFQSEQLTIMMYVCAPVFLFTATGSTAEAILRTEFRFGVLAFRSSVATFAGAAVAILLAHFGFEALALAAQRLVQAAISGLWVWSAVGWRPKIGGRMRWSASLLRDGGNVMTGTILPLLVPRSIDFFVAFALGPVQLGLMRLAFRTNDFVGQMVVMPLVSVANAQLSGVSDDLAAMRESYLRLTQASAALMCPVLIGLSLVAPEAVPILFGPQWTSCVPLVQIIGLLGLVAPVNYYFAVAMVALGRSRLVLRQGVFQVVLGVALAAAAAQISLIAIVIAHVIRGTLVGIYNMIDLRRHMGLRLTELARNMAPPYLATLVMAVAVIVARLLIGDAVGPLGRLLLLSSIGGASYAATMLAGGAIGLWPSYVALFRRLRRGRRKAATPA